MKIKSSKLSKRVCLCSVFTENDHKVSLFEVGCFVTSQGLGPWVTAQFPSYKPGSSSAQHKVFSFK